MTPPSPWTRWLGCIALSATAFVVAQSIAAPAYVSERIAYLIAFTCVAAAALCTSWFVPVARPSRLWILIVPSLALLWAATQPSSRNVQAIVVMISLLAGGTLVGSVVGSRIQAAGHLVFVALISSAADIFSVYAPIGPTAAVIESPASLNLLALPWPLLGMDVVPPILGVGDVIFAALYRSAGRAHQLSATRTMFALIVAFALTLAALLWLELPIPALPFLGLTMVIAHPEARRVPDADRKRGWLSALMLLVLLGILASYRP